MSYKELISKSRHWLADDVLPLWTKRGIDTRNRSALESLTREGEPMASPRRAMVQARQIYAFAEAARMGILPKSDAQQIVSGIVDFLIAKYSLPSGAFVHAVDSEGRPSDSKTDLYAQAFALFALAEAYKMLGEPRLKKRAVELMSYLRRERQLEAGGFSEMVAGQVGHEANPHMHMFEASIAWMTADHDEQWVKLATEIEGLCRRRFIDPASGGLCEHFDKGWVVPKAAQGFVWEPGHHYEWAWLMIKYRLAAGLKVDDIPFRLFETAERQGLDANTGMAIDEVWSQGGVKKRTSRFWPQGERVKGAVALGALAPPSSKAKFARAADDAMMHLFKFFEGMKPGLWEDTRSEAGVFIPLDSVKASSLYHIINAMAEYERLRPTLGSATAEFQR